MKKYITFTLIFFYTLFLQLEGHGNLCFTGEWIYLRPIIDSPYYWIQSSTNNVLPEGKRRAQHLKFDSGFRVAANYCCNPYNFGVSWLHFSTHQIEKKFGQFFDPSQGPFLFPDSFVDGIAESDLSLHINRVEALFGQWTNNFSKGRILFTAGLQYSDLSAKNHLFYVDSIFFAQVNARSRYWGIGPQIGINTEWCLYKNLSFTGCIQGSILLGENNGSYFAKRSQFTTPIVSVSNEKIWRFVHNTFIRAGLSYKWCLLQTNWMLDLGYQFLTYSRALGWTIYPNSNLESLSIDLYSNTDFHGPYASLSVAF